MHSTPNLISSTTRAPSPFQSGATVHNSHALGVHLIPTFKALVHL
ncbi:unnamed protein product, partial [Vitis vinifera]